MCCAHRINAALRAPLNTGTDSYKKDRCWNAENAPVHAGIGSTGGPASTFCFLEK
jgi:hypothetical protein